MQSVTQASEPGSIEHPVTIDQRMELFRNLEAALVEAASRTAAPRELAKAAKTAAIRWLFGVRDLVIDPPDLYQFALRALTEELHRWKSTPDASQEARRADDEQLPAPAGCCHSCAMNRVAGTLRELQPIELYSHYLHQQGLDDIDAALVLHTAPAVVQLYRQRAQRAVKRSLETVHEIPLLPNPVITEVHLLASE